VKSRNATTTIITTVTFNTQQTFFAKKKTLLVGTSQIMRKVLKYGNLSLNDGVQHWFRRTVTRENKLRLGEMMKMITRHDRVGAYLHYSICEALCIAMTER
jgi:hypothetical protein